MRKILKWVITLIMPLLFIKGAVWVLYHASYRFTDHYLPTFSDWQYWVRILLYGAIAVYLFYLYQSRYAKKELAVLVIPLLYLAFFSLPLSALEGNVSVMTFSHRFFSGVNVPVLLLFAYLVKTVATALTWVKDGKPQKKECLSTPPAIEENAFE